MSKHEGVRYREHATRRHGRYADRYIVVRYRVNGRRIDEAIGWTSQGASLDRAAEILAVLRQNHRTGSGPQTLAEVRALAQAEREAEASALASARQDLPVTVGDLYASYIAQAERTKKSWRNDGEIYRGRLSALAGLTLVDITPDRVAAHRDVLAATFAPASVRHALGLLRRMVRWGAAHYGRDWPHDIPANPLAGVDMPRVANARLRYLRRSEADALLEWLAEHDPLLRDIVLLCLFTGMRRGEAESVRCGHVDLDAGVISVVDPKSRVTRETVSIPDNIAPMLAARVAAGSPGALLFPSPVTGGRIHSISPRFRAAVDALGLNDGIEDRRFAVTFHSLRHTYISWLVISGVDIRTVQEMARHRSFEMTLRYAHLAPRARRTAANLLAGFADS